MQNQIWLVLCLSIASMLVFSNTTMAQDTEEVERMCCDAGGEEPLWDLYKFLHFAYSGGCNGGLMDLPDNGGLMDLPDNGGLMDQEGLYKCAVELGLDTEVWPWSLLKPDKIIQK